MVHFAAPARRALTPADAGEALVWSCDSTPGIRRQRRGAGFVYLLPSGRRVSDPAVLQRIRRLAVPPAYEDVWICPHAHGHLQATGRDARGRKQYRYHADWTARRGQTKFDHLLDFGRALPALRSRVQRRLRDADGATREAVLATLVRMLDATWLRVGNDEYARTNGSYGLSTLRPRHVQLRGAELRLSFNGKSGVHHELRLTDRRVAQVVRRCRELPGQELFHYVDEHGNVGRVGSADINAWLVQDSGGAARSAQHISAKDFRTWHASVLALELTLNACKLATPTAPGTLVAEVARRLRNTAAVCRKAYIHPAVLALGEELRDAERRAALLGQRWVQQPPARRGLTLAERQLVALLGNGLRKTARKNGRKARPRSA